MARYLEAFEELNVSCKSYFLASDGISDVRKNIEIHLRERHAHHQQDKPLIVTLDYSQGDPYDAGGYRWRSFLSKLDADRVQNTIDFLTELEVSGDQEALKIRKRLIQMNIHTHTHCM